MKLTSACCSDHLGPTLSPAACCSLTSGALRLYARLLSALKLLLVEKENFEKWEKRSKSLGGGFEGFCPLNSYGKIFVGADIKV